jgi:hypothetical protein
MPQLGDHHRPVPIPGHHNIRPDQLPRPFATPVNPSPAWDYYPYYRREPESEDDIRRSRRRYESFPPPDPAERGLYPGLNIVSPRTGIGRLSGDKGALDVEPYLAKELVGRKYIAIRAFLSLIPVLVFFSNQHPANLMFHRPTFMLALSKGQVPVPLLNSIFALAAPYSSQPALRTNPSWHAGERFAQVRVPLSRILGSIAPFSPSPPRPQMPSSLIKTASWLCAPTLQSPRPSASSSSTSASCADPPAPTIGTCVSPALQPGGSFGPASKANSHRFFPQASHFRL